jgi:endoglucanase
MLFSTLFTAASLASAAFAAPAPPVKRKLRWFGINESGAEFGDGKYPGVYNTDYTWYDLKTIDVSYPLFTLPFAQNLEFQ